MEIISRVIGKILGTNAVDVTGQRRAFKLEGKVALITGGGTGIGAAIAKRFVDEGAKVCITGRRQEVLDEFARTLPKDKVTTCSGDVTVYKDIQGMVDATLKFGGKIDVLVNNAGIDPGGTVVDLDPEIWKKVMETNVTGPFLLMKATIPHMIKNGGGSVINISSLGGLRCLPGMPAYCTSKGRAHHADQTGRIGLWPLQDPMQCRLPGRDPDGLAGGGTESACGIPKDRPRRRVRPHLLQRAPSPGRGAR